MVNPVGWGIDLHIKDTFKVALWYAATEDSTRP